MIFFISCIVFIIFLLIKYRYTYWKRVGVPHPEPTLFLGNVGEALTFKKGFAFVLLDIYNKFKGYDYVGIYNGWTPGILIRNPEICKNILIKDFKNFHDNYLYTTPSVDPILGRNPFVTRGDKWKTVRNRITSQLTPGKIKLMMPITNEVCNNMINYIKTQTGSGINAKTLGLKFTIDNVVNCSFGLEVKSFENERTIFSTFYEATIAPGNYSFFKQTIGIHFPLLAHLLGYTFVGEKIPKSFYDVVENTIKYREENGVHRNDYLDALRACKDEGYTKDDIIADVGTFFQDGTETSSLLFSTALYELAVNPLVQDKARENVETVVKKYGGKITFEGLQEMIYLHNLVQENLRKNPPIFLMNRMCTEDYKLTPPKKGGKEVLIKKGTPVYMLTMGNQWDPQYYPEPEKFDPDRFLPANESLRPKCSFLAMGEGPRICIGKAFGIYQQKAGLAALLLNFEIRLSERMEKPLVPDTRQIVFNLPAQKIWIEFLDRNKNL